MRVALITDGIWPYVLGGMQKHSFYLCKYLAQNKIYVDLFHFNQSNYDILKLEFFSAEELVFIEAKVINFPVSRPFPGHYLFNSYKYSRLVFDAIKGQLPVYDFIYTKGFSGWFLIEQKKSGKITCAPVGVKFHGYEMFQKPPDFKTKLQFILLLRRPVKWISQNANIVFSYGARITNIIRSIGVDPKKIFEFPSGVEKNAVVDFITPTSDQRNVLFLGRYERRKGVEELNEAINLFLASGKNKNCVFHFIGPIPQEKQIKDSAVHYHGEIRNKDKLQQLMRACDVLVCPSWSEGMPNVILEAMANGLAVIATDVGATSLLVNDETGWLLQSSEPEEIKTAIEVVSKIDSSALDVKKRAALEHIRNTFTWEHLGIKLAEFIKNIPKP